MKDIKNTQNINKNQRKKIANNAEELNMLTITDIHTLQLNIDPEKTSF